MRVVDRMCNYGKQASDFVRRCLAPGLLPSALLLRALPMSSCPKLRRSGPGLLSPRGLAIAPPVRPNAALGSIPVSGAREFQATQEASRQRPGLQPAGVDY